MRVLWERVSHHSCVSMSANCTPLRMCNMTRRRWMRNSISADEMDTVYSNVSIIAFLRLQRFSFEAGRTLDVLIVSSRLHG